MLMRGSYKTLHIRFLLPPNTSLPMQEDSRDHTDTNDKGNTNSGARCDANTFEH